MTAKRQPRRLDVAIAELADRQHGVVGEAQLERLGLSRGGVKERIASGRLHPVFPGVYAVGHRVIPIRGRWMGAVLACGTGAVLSHWSAAAFWGIRRPRSGGIDVTLRPKSRSPRGIRRHASKVLPADEVTVEDEIAVTTVPRTLLDLAAVASADVVEFALREAEYLRLHDPLSLQGLIDRYPGRRGVRRARLALERRAERSSGRPRSPLEEVFVPFLRRHRLPRPQLNVWLEVGGKRYEVDCLWPNRQIVELDGWESHGTLTAFREDRARDRRLRVAGYSITHLTWAQLEDEPAQIAADLRDLLNPETKE
jgi:very-short-patch-repair endonuclease